MQEDVSSGLSPSNRNYVAGLVFFALLLLGPIQPLMVRTIYLIAIPVAVWLVLRLIGRGLDIDRQSNDYIKRAFSASLAGILASAAYQSATATRHTTCTWTTQDGDCIAKIGPDKGLVFMLVLFACFAFWVAITRRTSK